VTQKAPGQAQPLLRVATPTVPARAVALILHGGSATSTRPVTWRSLASARMIPFAAAARRIGQGEGLVVARLRYGQRGWNGAAEAPVHDARWALDELSARFPALPIGLIGHSMGGRTALRVADHSSVRSVVALAPWIEADDPVEPLQERRVLVMHGDGDRITDPRASAEFTARLAGLASSATYIAVRGEKHAMLRRPRLWHRLAAGYTVGVLFGKIDRESAGGELANTLNQALGGQPKLTL